MSVDSHDAQNPEDAEAAESNPAQPDANQADTASEAPSIEEQLAAAQAKADDNWDQLLRAKAEMDNIRKRAEREASQARKYAVENIARELLPIHDSLALGQVELEKPEATVEAAREGMQLITQMMSKLMEQFSIQEINPEGEAFDPDSHQAMSMQETVDQPANTVLQVLQKGYRLNDRVLRPAMVIVAKAPQENSNEGQPSDS